MGFLDLRRVSSSRELKTLYVQHVHRRSGIDHEFSVFWLLRRGCWHSHASVGEQYVALSFVFESRHSSPNFMILCGRIFLGARFPLVNSPQTWARKVNALEVHTVE